MATYNKTETCILTSFVLGSGSPYGDLVPPGESFDTAEDLQLNCHLVFKVVDATNHRTRKISIPVKERIRGYNAAQSLANRGLVEFIKDEPTSLQKFTPSGVIVGTQRAVIIRLTDKGREVAQKLS